VSSSRRIRQRACALAAAALLLLGAALPASAQEYGRTRKALRGLAGLTTGFLEIPGRVVVENRERKLLPGTGVGLVKGLAASVPRTLVGLYELLTFPVALPRGFVPLIEPEFAWEHFEEPPSER
jgi:putative exosortase-associated protein (TIGR04073 family)